MSRGWLKYSLLLLGKPFMLRKFTFMPIKSLKYSVVFTYLLVFAFIYAENTQAQNDAMLQSFYWDVPVDAENKDGFWYDSLSTNMKMLKDIGITEIWMPSPSKGNWGITDMGYGIHDHYDLGKYEQLGTTETRFGSYNELKKLIFLAHDTSNGPRINLLADIILNHIYSTQAKDLEENPSLNNYLEKLSEGIENNWHPYPLNEIVWELTGNETESLSISLQTYPTQKQDSWDGSFTIEIDTTPEGLFVYNSQNHKLVESGAIFHPNGKYASQFSSNSKEFQLTISNTNKKSIYLKITANNRNGNDFIWSDQMIGLFVNSEDIEVKTLTTTGVSYVHKQTEPNIKWNHTHFHPGYEGDFLAGDLVDYQVTPNLKWFGHDFNHQQPEVLENLSEWGRWLRDSIGYDGYRFDFVLGVEEDFVANWISRVWQDAEQQATMVVEYFSPYKEPVFNWHKKIYSQTGQEIKMFDFPLKFELNELCNSPESYDMRSMLHAGMLFDTAHSLKAHQIVTFIDNHDTGKESDKWIVKNHSLAYSYIFFAPPQPCVFYNHLFGDTMVEFHHNKKELPVPIELRDEIIKLLEIRRTCLGGEMRHISDNSEQYKNFYFAFREGNESCSGAFLTLNNAPSEKVIGLTLDNQYHAFFGKELINLLNTNERVKVNKKGKVTFLTESLKPGIWVLKSEL